MKATEIAQKREVLTLESPIVQTIIESIKDKKGENIVSLNLTKVLESTADFFIFCEASNHIQLSTIADNIQDWVREECDQKPSRVEGKKGQQWIVLDYFDVVIHCMMPEARAFYSLEELWHDANKNEH